jgi:predicted nuclease of predicted toxin-antitoxin system
VSADENIPAVAIAALRARGHDVQSIREEAPGSGDDEVLARARTENRLLITFDKDFGELVFRAGLASSSGIVLFRIAAKSPRHVAEIAVNVLESRTDWAGHFSVIEEKRIRMTKLPPSRRT